MDCCKEKVKDRGEKELEELEHGHSRQGDSGSDWKAYLLLAGVALTFLLSVYQFLELNSLKQEIATKTLATAAAGSPGGAIDMAGWTENEKMMYEHHGTLPARMQGSAGAGSAGQLPSMVGGC